MAKVTHPGSDTPKTRTQISQGLVLILDLLSLSIHSLRHFVYPSHVFTTGKERTSIVLVQELVVGTDVRSKREQGTLNN